jgi:hypothetical protein
LTDDRACGADDVVASLHRRENGKRRFQMIDDNMRAGILVTAIAFVSTNVFAQLNRPVSKPEAVCPGCVTVTIFSGNNQPGGVISASLKDPLVARAIITSTGLPVPPNSGTIFSISQTPENATGATLSDRAGDSGQTVEVGTVANGLATAQFAYGNLPGTYQIKPRSPDSASHLHVNKTVMVYCYGLRNSGLRNSSTVPSAQIENSSPAP